MKKKKNKNKNKNNGYFKFLFRKEQALDWVVIFLVVAVGCFFVTRTYPYPRTMGDSYGYIWAAMKDRFTHVRPFGYSFFLQIVSKISKSIWSVIVSNALVYALSAGTLLLAVKKYWPPKKKWYFYLFEALVVASPAAIFMLDTILSDTLQCSLIFLTLAMVIVMVKEGSWVAMAVYVITLFCSFSTRYTAIFFPLAFVPVFALNGKKWFRITSILLTVAAFSLFCAQRVDNMAQVSGQRQFSTGFEGWQLANNALHVIPSFDMKEEVKIPNDENMKELHRFVLRYEMVNNTINSATEGGKKVTAALIWNNDSPLKQYMYRNIKKEDYSLSWIMLGTGLYSDYGKWLILHYPGRFLRNYLLRNSMSMFFPRSNEVICGYEDIPAGKEEIVDWFSDAPQDKVLTSRGDAFGKVVRPLLPWIELLTWLIFLGAAIILLFKKKDHRLAKEDKAVLWVIFLFGFVYYSTTTFASPIALRYWMPMHAVKLVFAWIALWSAEILKSRHSET